MGMALKVFPTSLLGFESFAADIGLRKISGGESLSGVSDEILTDGGGKWFVEASDPYLDEPESALAYDAISALLGEGEPFIVPLTDARSQMMGAVTVPPGGLPWWAEADFGTPESGVTVGDAAALRATTLTLAVEYVPQPIRVGQRFSIDHTVLRHRAYMVVEIVSDDGEEIVLKFRPPLREAVEEDALVEFVDPKCVMKLDGDTRAVRTLGFADSAGLRLVEDFSASYS